MIQSKVLHENGAVVNQNNKSFRSNQLTLYQRILSASTGAVITSLLVTPFDVVKTRLQVLRLRLKLKLKLNCFVCVLKCLI